MQFYDPSQGPLYHHVGPQSSTTPATIYQNSTTNTMPAIQQQIPNSNSNVVQTPSQPMSSYTPAATPITGTGRPASTQHHHMHVQPLGHAQYIHAAPSSSTAQIVPTHHPHHQTNPYAMTTTNGLPTQPQSNYSYYTSHPPHHHHLHQQQSQMHQYPGHQMQPHYVIIQHPSGMNQPAPYYSGHYQHHHNHQQHHIVNNTSSAPVCMKSNESNSTSNTNTSTVTSSSTTNNSNNSNNANNGSPSFNNSTTTMPSTPLTSNQSNLSQQFATLSLTNGIHTQVNKTEKLN
jgi:hypothetical protein